MKPHSQSIGHYLKIFNRLLELTLLLGLEAWEVDLGTLVQALEAAEQGVGGEPDPCLEVGPTPGV